MRRLFLLCLELLLRFLEGDVALSRQGKSLIFFQQDGKYEGCLKYPSIHLHTVGNIINLKKTYQSMELW